MNHPAFPSHSLCTDCEMYEEAHSIGIPMEWEPLSLHPCPSKDCPTCQRSKEDDYTIGCPDCEADEYLPDIPAVVVVGQNPGYCEDRDARNFVISEFHGKPSAGKTLREAYLTGIDLFSHASVYYVNAARCGPRSTTKVGIFNACIPYLWEDIALLHENHSRIALLFVSAPAVRAFWKLATGETVNQKKSLAMQGRETALDNVIVACFSTYHPAWINRGNFKALHRVDSHMNTLLRWVKQEQPASVPLIIVPTRDPNDPQTGGKNP